ANWRALAQRLAERPVVRGEGQLEEEVQEREQNKPRCQFRHRASQPVRPSQKLNGDRNQNGLHDLYEEKRAEDATPNSRDLVGLWQRVGRKSQRSEDCREKEHEVTGDVQNYKENREDRDRKAD